ncbi:FKBP-like protein [Rickenella mellea]|uniref:Peptidyl-prolyl cis-trans isomerase n=1 Tax=Rickenella mellea TaxID=50990 RepID=A0A4Y7PUI0_9AGAM|nr:FKBP-like protein [Rickenella mellea]
MSTSMSTMMTLQYLNLKEDTTRTNQYQKSDDGTKETKPEHSSPENKHEEIQLCASNRTPSPSRTPSPAEGSKSSAFQLRTGSRTPSPNRTPSPAEGSKSSVKRRSQQLATEVKVRHILCQNREKALEAIQKIKDGKRFDEVCHEYGDRQTAGGSLGWISKGMMVEAFESAAFALEPSTLENPTLAPLISTAFGYHIILVEDRR